MEKCKLTDVKLYKDDEGYYLRLEYEKEDDLKISKMVIPKARLPLYNKPNFIDTNYCIGHATKAEIGDDIILKLGKAAPLGKPVLCVTCWEELIEEKKPTKEMTIEEIEKTLGHKVKIIGEIEKTLGHKVKIIGEKYVSCHTEYRACSTCRHLNLLTGGCRLSCKNLEKWTARDV